MMMMMMGESEQAERPETKDYSFRDATKEEILDGINEVTQDSIAMRPVTLADTKRCVLAPVLIVDGKPYAKFGDDLFPIKSARWAPEHMQIVNNKESYMAAGVYDFVCGGSSG